MAIYLMTRQFGRPGFGRKLNYYIHTLWGGGFHENAKLCEQWGGVRS